MMMADGVYNITNTFIKQYSLKRWNMKHKEHRKMQLQLLN